MPDRSRPPRRPWKSPLARRPIGRAGGRLAGGRAVAAAIHSGARGQRGGYPPDDLTALDCRPTSCSLSFMAGSGRTASCKNFSKIAAWPLWEVAPRPRESASTRTRRRKWHAAGLPTAPWWSCLSAAGPEVDQLEPPLVLKPLAEGSSIGITLCDTVESLKSVLPRAVSDFGRVMLERRLEGPEVTVGILGHDPLP